MFRVRTLRVGILGLLLATCAWQLWPEVRAYWPRPVGADEVLIPVTRDGMAGYIDPNGRERLPFVWESTYAFGTSGLAMVRRDDKYGKINRHGQIVVEPRWVGEWPLSTAGFGWEVSEALDAAGWARVARDGKWGWIDRHGLIAIEPQWEAVMDFDPAGLALVRHDDKLGWIDRQGRVVIKPRWKYHNQTVESQGRAWYVVFGWNESLLYRLWAKLPAAWPQPKSPMCCACYDSTGRLIWSSDDRFRRRLIAGACATILVLYGLYAGIRRLRAARSKPVPAGESSTLSESLANTLVDFNAH